MVCKNCGANVPETSKFCTTCGATIEAEAVQEVAYGEPAVAAKDNSKFKKFIIPVAAAVVAVIVAVILIITGSSYKSTIRKYFSAIENGSGSKLQACFPLDVKMKKADGDSSSEIKEYYKDRAEDLQEELEEEYGDNFKIKYKITDVDKADKDDLESLEKLINMGIEMNDSDVKDVEVTAGYEVELEVTIKGSEGEDTEDISLTLVKIDGKWNVIDF